ncbi:PREDICTED: uncharacterized protein At2g24330 [Tarenaya hassleriana]|uniref:uncharacterized protein At2g24330 n=1 Tax=Tarenaya hassleriana TaxID=28532 RepID=UPI00053C9FBF|nr:PREDICTED: uncharacterized protein At2g24330 [Tarenaya hassleriana]
MAQEREGAAVESSEQKDSGVATPADGGGGGKKKRKGFFSRLWNGIFRARGDDFEKRLQYISREEATVLSRMKRRSQTWRKLTRNLIVFSIIFEVIAVGYAIMTTRKEDMDWKMRTFRILPMFLLPALSSLAYSSIVSFSRMCDRRDQKTLEKLRAERQAKIDELKERTNYYTTQQLIQRYDPDPAAKAAAATVLASKLGADSGLKVFVGDESQLDPSVGKSHDMEVMQSRGLRHRKQPNTRPNSTGSTPPAHHSDNESPHSGTSERISGSDQNQQMVVEHFSSQGYAAHDGSWISRIAALLVGEDPTQSYALICGNCHMHNGLARKEDFPYITYYCPHCQALNRPKNHSEDYHASATRPETVMGMDSLRATESEGIENSGCPPSEGGSPVVNAAEIKEEEAATASAPSS